MLVFVCVYSNYLKTWFGFYQTSPQIDESDNVHYGRMFEKKELRQQQNNDTNNKVGERDEWESELHIDESEMPHLKCRKFIFFMQASSVCIVNGGYV